MMRLTASPGIDHNDTMKAKILTTVEPCITPAMHYDGWAASYDGDMKGWGYKAPRIVAEGLVAQGGMTNETPDILDLGIGTGLLSSRIKSHWPQARITGVDVSRRMLAACRKKGVADRLFRMDLNTGRWPFPDKSFDVVMSAGVMESLPRLPHILQEAARVLRPGGLLAFTFMPAGRTVTGDDPVTRHLSPGRRHGRFVMGPMDLYAHDPLNIRVQCALAGIKTLAVRRFTGYRTYVVLKVDYDLFLGRKQQGPRAENAL
ncbi:MAG: class I SAM-dependent methyltransferase [Rhodospirillales bacterium]|nr:class I SAM-dependent methyltransferase [Rhodospirillales bacterium]